MQRTSFCEMAAKIIGLISLIVLLMFSQTNLCFSEDPNGDDDSSGFKIEVSVKKPNRLADMLFQKGHYEEAKKVLHENSVGRITQKEKDDQGEKLSSQKLGSVTVKPDHSINQLFLTENPRGNRLTNATKTFNFDTALKKSFNRQYQEGESIWEKLDRIRQRINFINGAGYNGFISNKPKLESTTESNNLRPLSNMNKVGEETQERKTFYFDASSISKLNEIPNLPKIPKIPDIDIQRFGEYRTLSPIHEIGPSTKSEEIWTGRKIKLAVKSVLLVIGLPIVGIYYCGKWIKKRRARATAPTREEALRAVPVYHV